MSEHVLPLINGETITVESTLSINAMKRLRETGEISKDMLNRMLSGSINANEGLEGILDDIPQAIYIAYLNYEQRQGNEPYYTKQELFDQLPHDIVQNAVIYGEIIGGPSLGKKFSESFQVLTKKK